MQGQKWGLSGDRPCSRGADLVEWSRVLPFLSTTEGDIEANGRTGGDHQQGEPWELIYVQQEIGETEIGGGCLQTPLGEEAQGQGGEAADDGDGFRSGLEEAGAESQEAPRDGQSVVTPTGQRDKEGVSEQAARGRTD